MRYKQSLDDRDRYLDTSILQFTRTIFLPFDSSNKHGPNPISAFFFLTEALFFQLPKHQQHSNARYCIRYLRYLRDLSPEAFGISSNKVATLLVHALCVQARLEPDNAIGCFEEMSVLCQELLASDLYHILKTDRNDALLTAFDNFGGTVVAHFSKSLDQHSQRVVETLREANRRLPSLQLVSLAVFMILCSHFTMTLSNDDYQEAMDFLDGSLVPHSSTDSSDSYLGVASNLAAGMAYLRVSLHKNPEYLEEAIFRHRSCLDSISPADPERHVVVRSLAELERRRLDEFGVTGGLPELHSSNPKVILPSFSDLAASLDQSNVVKMNMATLYQHFIAIRSTDLLTERADIEEAVKYCRLLLKSLEQSPYVAMIIHATIAGSGLFLYRAFELTNNAEYLDESIDVCRGIVKTPHAQYFHFMVFQGLIGGLLARFRLSRDRNTFDEVMEVYPIAVTNTYANLPDQFEMSCRWAQLARDYSHSSIPTAYKTAISLMQDSLTFAPTLEIQHFRLVTMRNDYKTLPSHYASYLVHIGQLKEAVEILERGRGLLWSEMRGLRTSIDQLRVVDTDLAEKFAAINRDLEALTTLGSPNAWADAEKVEDGEEMGPFGRILVKQRKLLDEQHGLITQIRSLPGFENFLMAPSFDALCSAAACGPVIIINHSQWRSDILILLHNSPPSLITTTNDFYQRAIELSDRLVNTRKQHRLESKQYQHALRSVLEGLYELVGRPVIDELHKLNVPEQSRVWWCPTSVFCFLPLHAMGPIPSEDGFRRYFLDLYIPSYTPTISALIESRKFSRQSLEKPSLLLVAQPDESLLHAWPEISCIQRLDTDVTPLISEMATPSAVVEGLQDHRFAHFVCHGNLESGKPFDASFQLYGGKRLTLLDIVQSQLATAEFAFLSACHTAEITDGSVADEALHLAAAVQYCGFRSVVGTMWAMADMDGHGLVENFYKSTFSKEESWTSVPYHQRTARALRDAVKKLCRRKGVPLQRWVNFVHYGA
jgi:CHAT domain-containing protein